MPSLVTSASVALSALALMLVSYLNEWLFGFLPLAAISLELWLLPFGYSGPFFESLSTRMVGNILGTLAVLYAIKAFVVISGRLRSSKINSNAIAK
jgi:hypothetical protein